VSEDEFARQGFTEYEAFERLTAELPSYLVPIATTSYHTGIRLVDSRLIRLRRGRTKGGQPRTCPFIADMEKVLLAAKEERDEFWPDCQYVLSRLGKPLKDIRGAWDSACERAGIPELQFYDLRRSGVRNLTRAGLPEKISMEIIGHKTRSTFDRYNIVAESDLVDAAARVAAYRDAKKEMDSDLNRGKNRGSDKNTNGPGSLQGH
jgi:integrase